MRKKTLFSAWIPQALLSREATSSSTVTRKRTSPNYKLTVCVQGYHGASATSSTFDITSGSLSVSEYSSLKLVSSTVLIYGNDSVQMTVRIVSINWCISTF